MGYQNKLKIKTTLLGIETNLGIILENQEYQYEIGDIYEGGILAYIFQAVDPGYIEGQTHGIIAAAEDTSTACQWGCLGSPITGADSAAIGSGAQNTIDIDLGCTTAGIAADLCINLSLSGKTDWFLPSLNELQQLYNNRTAIGGFSTDLYWASTETAPTTARTINFSTGATASTAKNTSTPSCRACRYF